jgi:asparagine synthase (glutamine-hydrolysing)
MCGFSLFITKQNIDNNSLVYVSHRGPDSTIIHKFKIKDYNISLAFHRLSIIDIEHGDQPFICKSKNRKIYLLCNGEIYNYKHLIEKYNLNTKSDCHVIFDMYLKSEKMSDIVKELDGEFAFVLLDIINDNINIYYARDRFGIRPLFSYKDETTNSFYFSSELKGIPLNGLGEQVQPRKLYHVEFKEDLTYSDTKVLTYYKIGINKDDNINSDYLTMLEKVRDTLIKSVDDRMQSERPIGALLSGGLDSSLVCGIASKILKTLNKLPLSTFCIGIEDNAPDILYARKVAKYINSNHHEIIIPVQVWTETLKNVIKQIETYDITTIRASTGQYLVSKWISENTDIKVILNGDGSDELCGGYLYFYNSPNEEESHIENIRLLSEIHKYDVLRVDRGISAWGLESRVPFLSHNFVDTYLSINKDIRNPLKECNRIEKNILRNAFNEGNNSIIPLEVLIRKKEAFSDAVSCKSKSWFEYIQEYVDTLVSDVEFENKGTNFPSKEAYWYYKIFKEYYPESELQVKYWMPQWCNEHNGDPSARKLVSLN